VSGVVDNFPACVAFTLAEEGGFSDDPRDPGLATNFGITQDTLTHWRGVPATVDDVRNLTQDEASAILRALYWAACNCQALPIGVDLLTFDFAVNAGPGTSARELQAAVGVKQDGMVGPDTEAAAAAADPTVLIGALQIAHETYYRSLAGFTTFGDGWLARLDRCVAAALAMVRGPAAPWTPHT